MSLHRSLAVPLLVLLLEWTFFQQVHAEALQSQQLPSGASRSCPQVSYPPEAESIGASGKTRVDLFFDAQGQVTEAVVSASAGTSPEHKLLDAAALAAAKACQFRPVAGVARAGTTIEFQWRSGSSLPLVIPGSDNFSFEERLEHLRRDWLGHNKLRSDDPTSRSPWTVVEQTLLGIALYRGPSGFNAVLALTKRSTGVVKGVRVGDPWSRVNASLGMVRPAWAQHMVPPSLWPRLSDTPAAVERLTVQVDPYVEATFVSDDNVAVTSIYLVSTRPVITGPISSLPPAPGLIPAPPPAGRASAAPPSPALPAPR